MRIKIKVDELFDKFLWDRYCKLTGTNEWAVNQGLLSIDDEVTLTKKEAIELGLLNEKR